VETSPSLRLSPGGQVSAREMNRALAALEAAFRTPGMALSGPVGRDL
jgi:hypothetical protein